MWGSNPGRAFFAQHHDVAEGPGISHDIGADIFAHPLPSRIQHSSAAQDQAGAKASISQNWWSARR